MRNTDVEYKITAGGSGNVTEIIVGNHNLKSLNARLCGCLCNLHPAQPNRLSFKTGYVHNLNSYL